MGHPEGFKFDEAPMTPKSPKNDVLRCCQLWNENEPRIASLEFDRDRKSMGAIVNSRAGKKSLLVRNTRKLIVDALQEMSTGA
nr:calcium-transporting atpase 1, endoplasmic reticulum-type [Quercus suber]